MDKSKLPPMDKSKFPQTDKNNKSLWEKVVDWNEKIEVSKRKRSRAKRVRRDAITQNYKKKKGNQ